MRRKRSRHGRTPSQKMPPAGASAVSSMFDVGIAIGLFAVVVSVYLQVRLFEFITLDDPVYVTENPHVQAGLNWGGFAWTFTTEFGGQWHPLTWLSHMLDCQVFGLDSGWHHLTNVAIHGAATVTWFAILYYITGARWRSALVAFLFGLHPLHVESVAWVCERKDVLSGLFCALTLWAYASYARRPGKGRYLLSLFFYCLGLMSKPTLVTLPLIMLLLDWWPLGRGIRLREKAPFFIASAVVSMVTIVVHQHDAALPSLQMLPISIRLENAFISYAVYIRDMIWPARLAAFYPYGSGSLLVPAVLACVGIVAATVAVLTSRRFPFLAVGWFWYLIMLLPVIGVIQAGTQSRADRFTYIPMIGISMAVVWGLNSAFRNLARVRVGVAAVVCVACVVLTWVQIGYWRNSATVYQHAITINPENPVIRFSLASVLEGKGDRTGAIKQLRETIRLRPNFATAHAELGQLLNQEGRSAEGVQELRTAVALQPSSADAHFRLGSVLGGLGRNDEAIPEFIRVIQLQPENADGHFNLGIALALGDNVQNAIREFSATIRLRPDDWEARSNLGIALARLGRIDEAIEQLSEAVRIRPGSTEARQALEDVKNLKRSSVEH